MSSKKILFCSNGLAGNVFPFIPVALELRKHGVQTEFMVNTGLNGVLNKFSLQNISPPSQVEEKLKTQVQELIGSEDENHRKLLAGINKLYLRKRLKILSEKINKYDLVILGGRDSAAILSLYLHKRQFLLFNFNPFKKESPESVFTKLIFNRFIVRIWLMLYTKNVISFLPRVKGLLRSKINIMPVSKLFMQPAGNIRVTGPVHQSLFGPDKESAGFRTFLQETKGLKKVTLAFGSYSDFLEENFLKTLTDVITSCGYCAIVISATELPASKHVFRFTGLSDLDEILPETDLVIHHCGHGTIIKCILHEKPFLPVPLFGVQFKLAEKLFKDGIAPKALDKQNPGNEIFRKALVELMEHPENYLSKIKQAKEILSQEDGKTEVTEIVLNELNIRS